MPTFYSKITDLVPGGTYNFTRTVLLVPATRTIVSVHFVVKDQITDADADALISKVITPTNQAGIGQITDTGADGTGAFRCDNTQDDTWLLRQPGKSYPYFIEYDDSAGDTQAIESGHIYPQPRTTSP